MDKAIKYTPNIAKNMIPIGLYKIITILKQDIDKCHGTPPWHLTHVHLFPPTQQLETDHEIAAIYGNLRQSAIFCHILPYSAYLFLPQYLQYPQRP